MYRGLTRYPGRTRPPPPEMWNHRLHSWCFPDNKTTFLDAKELLSNSPDTPFHRAYPGLGAYPPALGVGRGRWVKKKKKKK